MDTQKQYFKLPIYYNEKKRKLNANIIKDLELVKNANSSADSSANSSAFPDMSNNQSKSMYDHYLNVETPLAATLVDNISEYYTTDVNFLKDNQKILKTYIRLDESRNYKEMIHLWKEIKTDTGFKDKYFYINWKMWDWLNKSEHFLQIMSVYNMMSPLISLIVPIIILIVPFFVIRIKGVVLTMDEYIEVLKVVMSNHAIGKLFTQFNNVSTGEKAYLVISALFYVFSIYQNILVCIRFNENMRKIHRYLGDVRDYLDNTIRTMQNYITYAGEMVTHMNFTHTLKSNMTTLEGFRDRLYLISNYELSNYKKLFEIGSVQKYFYELYQDEQYNAAIEYSFGFNGYIDCIEGLQDNISDKKLHMCEYTDNGSKVKISNNYYAALKDETPIRNDIKLKENLIITGPNASGKTTILKSVMLNLIFSQQFGCGFYESAKIKPFDHIHCYLNIPDTSGRDSLFQAEARRCKEIIDCVNENKQETHFGIFDELYSGTNPDEAVVSATAFMEYMTKFKNVSCMLTTHYTKVCTNLNNKVRIVNMFMETSKSKLNNTIKFKYQLKRGISRVRGAFNILNEMNYPKEILEKTMSHNHSLL
jgi:ABC-type multidrug transport system fused ATPase/permease subunit